MENVLQTPQSPNLSTPDLTSRTVNIIPVRSKKISTNFYAVRRSLVKCIAPLLVLLLTSCHKEIEVTKTTDSPNLLTKVSSWLDAQKLGIKNESNKVQINSSQNNSSSTTATKNNNIELLKNALDYESALQSDINEKSDYIIIPINDDLKAKKHVVADASLALLLVTNKAGKIISGNIACYIPGDGKSRGANEGAKIVAAIMKGKAPKDSGLLKMMDVTGRRLHEIGFKNGLLSSYGVITNKTKDDASTATNSISCFAYYLVTTFYDQSGVVVNETREYLGTVCTGCDDGNYNSLCGSGGGGDYNVPSPWTEDQNGDINIEGTFVDTEPSPDGPLGMPNEPTIHIKCIFRKYLNIVDGLEVLESVNIFPAQIMNPLVDFIAPSGVTVTRDSWFSLQQNRFVPITLTTVWVEWTAGLHVDYGWYGGQLFQVRPFRQVKVG